MADVNPPPGLRLPRSWLEDKSKRDYLNHLNRILFQLWERTGGGTDTVGQTIVREFYAWDTTQTESDSVDSLYSALEQESETGFSYPISPDEFEWHEKNVTGNYTLSIGEWVNATAGTMTFPEYAGAMDKIRITKNGHSVGFNANGKKVRWRNKTYETGRLPGAVGSVFEFEYYVTNDEWQTV